MSKRASNKSKKNKKPVIVSQTVASTRGEGSPLLSGQQTKQIQELIDLLKKNSLTEMEIEREGLRIRVRYETGQRTMTATVQEPGMSVSTPASYVPATTGTLIEDTTGMITIASPIVVRGSGHCYRQSVRCASNKRPLPLIAVTCAV